MWLCKLFGVGQNSKAPLKRVGSATSNADAWRKAVSAIHSQAYA